jgi:hypothetical protein
MQNYHFIVLLFACFVLSTWSCPRDEIFEWHGNWKVWKAYPYDENLDPSMCCLPNWVKIQRNAKNRNLIDIHMNFPEKSTACPALSGDLKMAQNGLLGRFIRETFPGTTSSQFNGTYFPNNNTILFSPGPQVSNCAFELGSIHSFLTNTSEANDNMDWSGAWNVAQEFPAYPGAKCCVPSQPVIIYQDQQIKYIDINLYFTEDSYCPNDLKNRASPYYLSVDSGSFYTDLGENGIYGFYLQNGSYMIETVDCYMRLERVANTNPVQVAQKFVKTLWKDYAAW